jgi:hypothetical protein
MEYLGNYADLIKDDWITYWTMFDGQTLPDNRECLLPDFDQQNIRIAKMFPQHSWQKFETQDMPWTSTFKWPVSISDRSNIDWWVIKQHPGQMIPIHIDANPEETTSRYILCLQDYVPGHIMLWGDIFLKDFKKGDLFKLDGMNSLHGGCNISLEIRLIAYLIVWEPNESSR